LIEIDRALSGVDKVFMVNKLSPNMVAEANEVLSAIQKAGTVKHIVKLSFFGMDDAPDMLEAQVCHQKKANSNPPFFQLLLLLDL
jgi:uncharacterized protein YbjT (DUF2867 family)